MHRYSAKQLTSLQAVSTQPRAIFKTVVSEKPNACYFLLPVSVHTTRYCWLSSFHSFSSSIGLSLHTVFAYALCVLWILHTS